MHFILIDIFVCVMSNCDEHIVAKALFATAIFLVAFFSKKLPIVVVHDVCPSVCPAVRMSVCLYVRLSSVEIISFCANLISNTLAY